MSHNYTSTQYHCVPYLLSGSAKSTKENGCLVTSLFLANGGQVSSSLEGLLSQSKTAGSVHFGDEFVSL